MLSLKNRQVSIIGAQRSGLAVARLVQRLGGQPQISEAAKKDNISVILKSFIEEHKIQVEWGGHSPDFLKRSDFIILSPGVSIDAPIVQWARDQSIPVLGEIEFAAQFCEQPIIAVTGSNGKTTVVNLIHSVLTGAGYNSVLCGNVGRPFSDDVLDLADQDYVVLEISSFQLESLLEDSHELIQSKTIQGFKPHIAVFLNFSQNHLDRHKDLDEYFEAKQRIFENQNRDDFAVLNFGDERVSALAPTLSSQVRCFNHNQDELFDNPNHRAVFAVADILDISAEQCRSVFEDFKGVEHRMEWVRCIDGIDFVNDSKSTTAEASRWALNQIDRPILMICGGKDKNIDFSVLAELVGQKVKKMFVFGEAREKLKNTFDPVVLVEECAELENAVKRARASAAVGDCVVLTPMCASFDDFKNFEERGCLYKQIVEHLEF